MTLPIPPNPLKATKAAAARAAKEGKNRNVTAQPDRKQNTGLVESARGSVSAAGQQPVETKNDETNDEENHIEPKHNIQKWYMGQYGNNNGNLLFTKFVFHYIYFNLIID